MTFIRKTVDVLITLIIVVLLVLAFIWFVHTFDVFELPSFITKIIDPVEEYTENDDEFENELLSLLESEEYIRDEYTYLTVTLDKAEKLLSSVKHTTDYFWKVETSVKYGDDSRTQTHTIYKKGNSTRIDTEEYGGYITNIFANGKCTVIDNITGEVNEFGGDTDFAYSNIVNIAALDVILDKGTDVNVEQIALVDVDEEKYLYVEIPKKNVNGTDKYFISLTHGIIMYASSVIDGNEYFTQRTVKFDDAAVISDEAFAVTYSETGVPLTLR